MSFLQAVQQFKEWPTDTSGPAVKQGLLFPKYLWSKTGLDLVQFDLGLVERSEADLVVLKEIG